MPSIVVSTDIAGDVKPSFASSPIVGLTVRANGEERIKILTPSGEMLDALIPYNVVDPPTFANTGAAASLPPNKYAAYTYVYAATTRYPNVENDVSIGGSVAPRSNPSLQAAHQVDGTGHGITVSVPQINRSDIDQIWIFRTGFFATANEASIQAIAGNAFFLGAITNVPASAPALVSWLDENSAGGTDIMEVDNFSVPTFRYVIYEDPFWWGWGNNPFTAQVDFTTGGALTLLGGRKWFLGRDAQYVRLEGIDDGGIDGHGTYLFGYLTATTAHVQIFNADGVAIDATISSAGSNKAITIQGPSTTLYRSKPRNPFSWGMTEYFGAARVPSLFAKKIGGGQGTGIAVIPNLPALLLSTEFPAGAFTLDLRQAENDAFLLSKRNISKFYSITSHFSQFAATRSDGKLVLWGWDAKNYCILECDGATIHPISEQLNKTLRLMSPSRSRQQLAHGAFDARNGLNCMWLPTSNSLSLVNLLVAQHAQTQQWFIHDEHDVLCSAQFQDGDTNLSKIFVGTQSGFVGEAFAEGKYVDWLTPASPATGNVTAATSTTIESLLTNFAAFVDEPAYIGSWCLLTDANGEKEQWAKISGCNVATHTLTFDAVYSLIGGSATEFNPVPAAGWKFYIGLIEVRAIKYFDLNVPSADKKLSEIWLTIDNVDTVLKIMGNGSTFLRYYRDRSTIPYAPKTNGLLGVPLTLVKFMDAANTDTWVTQSPPTARLKTFGIEIIDRAYRAWKLHNWVLKVQ